MTQRLSIARALFMFLVEVISIVLFYFFFMGGQALPQTLWLALFPLVLGTIGTAGVGILLSTITASMRGKDVMLAVLFIPLTFPLLYACAATNMIPLVFMAYYCIRYFMTREQRFDTCAKCLMEVSLLFVIGTMVTGEMWTRFEWGVWWTWEPRLTTYLVLTTVTIAYFILRSAIDEPERRATYSTVLEVLPYIVVAYALVWLVLITWVAIQFRKQKRLSAQLSILEEELEDRKKAGGPENGYTR